jgi:hypothetical protein
MRRLANGNKAAMVAAFKDMASEYEYVFDFDSYDDKMIINDIVLGREYDFD